MNQFNFPNFKNISKGSLLLKNGEIARHTYLVIKGCLKSYVLDTNGKEHIVQFAPEGWLITNLDSFTNEQPSSVCIEAIEDTEVSFFTKSAMPNLESLEREMLVEMNVKFRNNVIANNKRIIGLLSASSKQRYIDFTETYPSLVQRLPLKLIAAYIGVTPEYLSEIRRKIASEN